MDPILAHGHQYNNHAWLSFIIFHPAWFLWCFFFIHSSLFYCRAPFLFCCFVLFSISISFIHLSHHLKLIQWDAKREPKLKIKIEKKNKKSKNEFGPCRAVEQCTVSTYHRWVMLHCNLSIDANATTARSYIEIIRKTIKKNRSEII